MLKVGVMISLVGCFAVGVWGADGSGNALETRGVAIGVLLEQMAKSPLEPGDAPLLRGIAELIEKEQSCNRQVMSGGKDLHVAAEVPAPVSSRQPVGSVVGTAPPMRLAFRLRNVPAAGVATALQHSLDRKPKHRSPGGSPPESTGLVIVSEPVSNCLLVSGEPDIIRGVCERIAQLDAERAVVVVDVCVAELLASPSGEEDIDGPETLEFPGAGEDGSAWLAWANANGRLKVLSRPQVMTLDKQPANIQIGETVPHQEGGSLDSGQAQQATVGLNVGVTPQVSPNGKILLELDVELATVATPHAAETPLIAKAVVQTTILARDGQTVVVGGPIPRGNEDRPLVVALTPHLNPVK